MKKILFVAFPNSVHVLRWIQQINDQDWDIHLYPSIDVGLVLPEFQNITVHHSIYSPQADLDPSNKEHGLRVGIPFVRKRMSSVFWSIARLLTLLRSRRNPDYRVDDLYKTIKRIQPDIVHSIEFQHGGYLALAVKQRMGDDFPTWIVTNFGSDVYLFGRLKAHAERVRAILQLCDYYDCECERDVAVAQNMGLQGQVVRPILPNAGGFDLQKFDQTTRQEPVSSRRQIVLKGYQHFAGRALVALQAVKQCVDVLQDYTIIIYSAFPDVEIAAEIIQQDTNLNIQILPHSSHETLLREFGKSRVYIALSISDAISTSMLEAMTMGVFPIQSNTACTNEWVVDGETALIVPPEDVHALEQALRRALSDDELVNNAAQLNLQTVHDRLDNRKIKPQIIDIYRRILGESGEA